MPRKGAKIKTYFQNFIKNKAKNDIHTVMVGLLPMADTTAADSS